MNCRISWVFAAALALSGAQAHAQSSSSGSLSGSEAGAAAAAIASPTINFMGEPGERTINQRLTTTPGMTAPNVFSSNPCIVSASGAVSAMGFGMALGAGVEDRDCTRRANAALLAQMGLARAAAEVLCHNSEVRASLAVAGVPCAADRPANTIMPNPPQPAGNGFSGAPARPNSAAASAPPVDATGVPVVAASAPAAVRARPDWCFTASPAERAVRPGVC